MVHKWTNALSDVRVHIMLSEKKFWNQKILPWEKSKYDSTPKLLDVNSSIKYRLCLTAFLLQQISEGKNLLELGCGSGRLWEQIKSSHLNSYTGVDFSETAITAFQSRLQRFKNFKISLLCDDCTNNTSAADVVISLGLLDWLTMKQIKKISEHYKKTFYLHSFSEKQFSVSQTIHSIYVFINYGYKTRDYAPHYRKADELLSVFGTKAKIYRDPKLSFGAFIHNLPDHVQFKI